MKTINQTYSLNEEIVRLLTTEPKELVEDQFFGNDIEISEFQLTKAYVGSVMNNDDNTSNVDRFLRAINLSKCENIADLKNFLIKESIG